jgi:hypothetical protein
LADLPFFFDARGYAFQSVLAATKKSAQAGLTALSHEINALEYQLDEYRRVCKFEGEQDEEGYVIWELGDLLNHEIISAPEGLTELRKAFAIAAFHLWERAVQQWITQENEAAAFNNSTTRKKVPAHTYVELVSAVENIGYSADLNLLRIKVLANTLKHNSEKSGMELLALWPDIFPPQFQKPSRLSDWASAIQLTDQHLSEIFNVVSKSGPMPFGPHTTRAQRPSCEKSKN